jgi:hypothetical protein
VGHSSNFVLNSITVKKCEISDTFLIQMTYLNGYTGFSISSLVLSYELLNAYFQTSTQEFLQDFSLFFTFKTAIIRKPLENRN